MKTIIISPVIFIVLTFTVKAQTPDSLKYTVLGDKEFIVKYESSPGATLIDARGPKEYRKSRIAGAINIEWPLPDSYFKGASAPSRDKPLFLYCYVGNRSRKAAVLFFDHGYREIYSLKGGFNGWKGHKMPVDRRRH